MTKTIAERLRTLADWLDHEFKNDKNPEVQRDLREWASLFEEATSLLTNLADYLSTTPTPSGINLTFMNKIDSLTKRMKG